MGQMLEEAIRLAVQAQSRAYCPYSSYPVGACIVFRIDSEPVFQPGCNVENISFGLSNCAERTAVFSSIAAHGKPQIELVAVATKDGGTPCGACLQVLCEFASPSCTVVCVNEENQRSEYLLSELMPHSFTSKALEKG